MFNATLVVASIDKCPESSRHRHAYIHLFNSSCDEEEASPPRPPTDDQEMAVNLVIIEEVCDEHPLDRLDEFGRVECCPASYFCVARRPICC
jgi:hypothetical protein